MLTNPRPGALVMLWYAQKPGAGRITPHHGQPAHVIHAGHARPRNHLVELASGLRLIVPAGNLRKGPEYGNPMAK